jgi:hypothetical protein
MWSGSVHPCWGVHTYSQADQTAERRRPTTGRGETDEDGKKFLKRKKQKKIKGKKKQKKENIE